MPPSFLQRIRLTFDLDLYLHQFGAEDRTIRAKKGKYLRFQAGNGWVTVEKVTVNIPARPFLGISEEDQKEIREEFEAELRRKG